MAELRVFAEFARLTARKRELEAELKSIEAQIAPIKEVLLTLYADNPDLGKVNINGYTVYRSSTLWAKVAPGSTKAAVLNELGNLGFGFEDVASVNSSRLSAIVREFGSEIPAGLAAVIETTLTTDVKAVKDG